jgi:hypothetical protein
MYANVSHERSVIVCSTCHRTLWWRSRTGMRVCMVCHPDPLDVLGTLLPLEHRVDAHWSTSS